MDRRDARLLTTATSAGFIIAGACACAPVGVATPTAAPTEGARPTPTALSIVDLQRTVVRIRAEFDGPQGTQTGWHGSGTVVSADGLILTNAHVVLPALPELAAMKGDVSLLDAPVPDRLVVDLAERPESVPEPRFVAEVAAADGWLDLAVLRVTRTADGTSIDPNALQLRHARVGDARELGLGQPVRVLGYPGLGGQTVTLSVGRVSGFLPQEHVGLRAWVKTDTAISPGSSGGLAVDDQGLLVAVPSQMALVPGEPNLLRPVDLAEPLLEAAVNGAAYRSPYMVRGGGDERLDPVAWASQVDEQGCAVREVGRFPFGTAALAAVFRYTGMTNGELLLAEWSRSQSRIRSHVWFWDAGSAGDCYPLLFDDLGRPLEAGAYAVVVRGGEDLAVVGQAETVVDQAPSEAPSSDSVRIAGRITDADSGVPIAGAVLIVFQPGVQAGQWNRSPDRSLDDIYTVGESDADGRYRLLRGLQRGVRYAVAADHPEYIELLGEFEIGDEEPAEHTVDLVLSR